MREREAIMQQIETAAAEFRATGACSAWLQRADSRVAQVSREVNGPLMEALADAIAFHDAECVQSLRRGAPFVDKLPDTGNGWPLTEEAGMTVAELMADALKSNTRVISRMREDVYAKDLHAACVQDASLGRMSEPVKASVEACVGCVISPRFGVLQGSFLPARSLR